MSWDPTPWFVGGGAQHSPEVARLLAYASTGAAEGIVTPGDLRVVPQDVAGSSVRVLAGAALILNRAPGGTQQTYVARNVSEDTVNISATGSGAGRSDLIVAEIRDPFMPGSSFQDPVDPTKGVYVQTTVVPNVSPTTTRAPSGMSGIALARIDIPANTAKITANMVKDLRKLARPRFESYKFSAQPPTALLPRGNNFERWPLYNPTVQIPEWATWLSMSVVLSGMGCQGNVDGFLRAAIGDVIGGNYIVDVDTAASREVFVLTASGEVTPTDRGRVVQLVTEGRLYPTSPGTMGSNAGSCVLYDVNFYERTV